MSIRTAIPKKWGHGGGIELVTGAGEDVHRFIVRNRRTREVVYRTREGTLEVTRGRALRKAQALGERFEAVEVPLGL